MTWHQTICQRQPKRKLLYSSIVIVVRHRTQSTSWQGLQMSNETAQTERIEQLISTRVEELLAEAGFKQPPVNPLLIGARHEIYFMIRPLPAELPGFKILQHGDSWVVTLGSDLPPENQTLAASRAVASILIEAPPDLQELKEQIVEQGAEELLMPRPWFEEALKSFGYDVAALKRRFGVPYDTVALRTLRFRPAILTIFENAEVVQRTASPGLEWRPEPSLAEREILQRAMQTSTYQRASDANGLIECQPIPQESGAVRVYCFKVPR